MTTLDPFTTIRSASSASTAITNTGTIPTPSPSAHEQARTIVRHRLAGTRAFRDTACLIRMTFTLTVVVMTCAAMAGCAAESEAERTPDINGAVKTLQARQPTVAPRRTAETVSVPGAVETATEPIVQAPSATRPPRVTPTQTIAPPTLAPTCSPGTLRPPGLPNCIPCQVGQFYTPGDTECHWPPTATVIAPPTRYVFPTVYVPPAPTISVQQVRLVKIIDSDSVLIQFGYSLFVANYGVGCLGMWRYEGDIIYLVDNRYSTFIGVGASFLLPNGDDCRIWTSEQVQ